MIPLASSPLKPVFGLSIIPIRKEGKNWILLIYALILGPGQDVSH